MSYILMLCHDQHLDRRVLAQAASLIATSHAVTLLALSHGPQEEELTTPEGIEVIRIGLTKIVPDNPTYRGYIGRQKLVNAGMNVLCNKLKAARPIWNIAFRLASRTNLGVYRALLLIRYRNRRLGDPLPFTSAFINAGKRFRPDLVQVHDLPALEAGAHLSAEWKIPLVYDAHELYPEQRAFSQVQRAICSTAEARLIKQAQLVFAVNESIAREMARRYDISTPVSLLNSVDPPTEFDTGAKYNLLREKLGLAPERRILLYQGGFAPYRNLETLINGMRFVRTSDVDLVLLGFGSFGDKLKSIAERCGLLNRRVYFLPAVPYSELLQHSASADIGIVPYPHVDLNSYYCTPNKLFEFIQAGLPILANQSPELERFVQGNDFGMTAPMKEVSQIAEAIDRAFGSSRFSAWRANLLRNRQRFTWQAQEQIYLDAINRLLRPTGENLHYAMQTAAI